MSHDDEIFLTVIGPESVMASIGTISIDGIRIDPPQPLDAMVDAVDAPLGPDEIHQLLMHATAVLSFGTVAVKFGVAATQLVGELKKLLVQAEPHEKPEIIIVDARTNEKIVAIAQDTNPEKAGETIKDATKS